MREIRCHSIRGTPFKDIECIEKAMEKICASQFSMGEKRTICHWTLLRCQYFSFPRAESVEKVMKKDIRNTKESKFQANRTTRRYKYLINDLNLHAEFNAQIPFQ